MSALDLLRRTHRVVPAEARDLLQLVRSDVLLCNVVNKTHFTIDIRPGIYCGYYGADNTLVWYHVLKWQWI